MTGAQIILLAARDLEKDGYPRFTPQELAVAAWKRSPETFGLEGFKDEHPDNKRVEVLLFAKKSPLRGRLFEDQTLIRKVQPGLYELTDLGRKEARKLDAEVPVGR